MERITKICWILAEMTLVIVLAGLNRKVLPLYTKAGILGLLNTSDCVVMLILAPWAISCGWRIFKIYNGPDDKLGSHLFILGIFSLGLGFGMHEPFNAMQRLKLDPALHSLVTYFDDDLGHWLFFIGFAFTSLSVVLAETANPYEKPLSKGPFSFGIFLGVIVAIVIWFQMRNEDTYVDIIVLVLTVMAAEMARQCRGGVTLRRLPVLLALHVGYGGGVLATILYWSFSGR